MYTEGECNGFSWWHFLTLQVVRVCVGGACLRGWRVSAQVTWLYSSFSAMSKKFRRAFIEHTPLRRCFGHYLEPSFGSVHQRPTNVPARKLAADTPVHPRLPNNDTEPVQVWQSLPRDHWDGLCLHGCGEWLTSLRMTCNWLPVTECIQPCIYTLWNGRISFCYWV